MKKISTPSLPKHTAGQSAEQPHEPGKRTIEFIRNFARACQSLPINHGNAGKLSVYVLN